MRAEPNRQIEISILKVMSDFSPRSQNMMATKIKKNCTKSRDRVKIHRAVKTLMKYFERRMFGMEEGGIVKLCGPDKSPEISFELKSKMWALKKDSKTISQIISSFPELLATFQSNDIVLSMLVEKHVNKMYVDEWLSADQELDFKKMLKVSPTFFKFYLVKEPGELKGIFDTLFSITEIGKEYARLNEDIMLSVEDSPKPSPKDKRKRSLKELGFAEYQPSFNDLINVIFNACVQADIMTGQDYRAGVEYILKNTKVPRSV